jgi:hypothetical protein
MRLGGGVVVVMFLVAATSGCVSSLSSFNIFSSTTELPPYKLDVVLGKVETFQKLQDHWREWQNPRKGYVFVAVTILFRNVGAEEIYASPRSLTLKADDMPFPYDERTTDNTPGGVFPEFLGKGVTRAGVAVFQIPSTAKATFVEYNDPIYEVHSGAEIS